ncbi:MAG: hypothetical protein ACLP5H_27300 [Desulfomonilaceae bacterium]
MKNLLMAGSMIFALIIPALALAEEQVRDSTGRVVEIRQSYGGTSYAYDGNRNPIYTATVVEGGKDALDYRDHHGVHIGIAVPGTAQDLQHKWGRGLFHPDQNPALK